MYTQVKMQLQGYTDKQPKKGLVICVTMLIFLMIIFTFQDSFFNPNSNSWQPKSWNMKSHLPSEVAESIKQQLRRLVTGSNLTELETSGLSCSSDVHTEECVISKPLMFDKQSLTIYIPSNQNQMIKRKIKPYARREDKTAMERVSPLQILYGNVSSINPPGCQFSHDVPAFIFSFGGFSENIYHDFNEILIPLYMTSRHFESQIQFVITDYRARWIRKFSRILKQLSRYEIIDADADETVHCFPAAVVGLRYHDNLALNSTQIPGGYSMAGFREFLRDAYNLKRNNIMKPQRPKLLLLSREESRKLLNEDEIVKMMENLGFQVQRVLPGEMTNLQKFAEVVNSCDIMVAVHGAGLTNEIFLPNGGLMLQIVPLGMEWGSEHFYAKPAVDMGLKYLEYKVEPNETSLYEIYGPNNPVITDPASIWAKGYRAVKEVYLDQQDFRINLVRFKNTLLQAIKLIK